MAAVDILRMQGKRRFGPEPTRAAVKSPARLAVTNPARAAVISMAAALCLSSAASFAQTPPSAPEQPDSVAEERAPTYAAGATVDWLYTVRPNDTLWSISNQYLDPRQPWHKLIHYNQIAEPTELKVGMLLKIPVSWLKQQPEPAVVLTLNGQVRLRKAQESKYQSLKQGQALRIGDEIHTDEGSVNVRFADGSLLRLNEHSVLLFNSLTRLGQTGMVDTRTRLMKGSLSTQVTPQRGDGARYEISTPSAVAAVRGTQFRLEANEQSTKAEVTEGVVHLISGGRTLTLNAGYGAKAGPALAQQEPVELLPQPKLKGSLATVDQLPWQVDWQPVQDAKHYVVEVFEEDQSGARVRQVTLEQPGWQLDDLNNGTYLLALRAVDSDQFQGVDFSASFKIDLHSLPALLVAPNEQEELHISSPLFSWQLQRNADASSLEIARDAGFTEIVSKTPFERRVQAKPDSSLAPGRYYWRVATVAGGTSFSQSASREFKVVGDMPQTSIIAVNYLQENVRLFWKSLEETNEFIIQVAADPQFNQILREERVAGTNVSVELPDRKAYYARVKGVAGEFHRSEFSPGREIALP